MNYTLDISSDLNEYTRKIKKISSNYSSNYSKKEVTEKIRSIIKDLGLKKCKIDKSVTFIRFSLLNDEGNVCAEVKATPVSKTEKIVVKFAEHKYFKNLKYLFGSYKTELTQAEGSSELTTEAYIRSIIGANFHATDLSPSDKFVSVEEVDLRSPYMEALNNILFQATRSLEGEIYGITENNELYICGKRTQAFQRLYDSTLISALDDISPAVIVDDTVEKVADSIDFSLGEYEKPKYTNIKIKKPMNDSYELQDNPSFKYFKNLLVFEAKLNLASPRLVEKPDFDNGEFQLVCNALNQGDEIISAVALDGSGTRTHTIVTNVKQKCRYLASKGEDLVAIMADGKVYTANNVNFESVTSITMETEGKEFSVEGAQLIDMIYDDVEGWVGTFGYEATQGTDFYGDKYYKFMVSKSLNSVMQSGESAATMYAAPFESSEDLVALTFKNRSSENLLKVANTTRLEIVDTYGGALGTPDTSFVNPNDLAIRSYTETDVTGGEYNDLATVGPIVKVDDKEILQNIIEGPYIVNPAEYEEDNAKMYQKIFSDGDMDIVLQQDYIFIKTKLYTVDETGAYTRSTTRGKHWLGAMLPITLDSTLLKLRSMPVTGTTSCYNYVLDNIKAFCSWALDTAQKAEIGDEYTFTNLALNDTFTEDELNCYKNAIKPLSANYTGNANTGRGLLTYSQFLSLGVSYYSGNTKLDGVTNDNYSVYKDAIDKVVFETALPLTSDLKVDDTARFQLVGTADNNVILMSKEHSNLVDFEEAYRLYLLHAFTYVRGIREAEDFGAKLVTNIYSFNNSIYFRCYTGEIFFINKQYLHKAEDIETMSNWRVSQQPGLSHINGWDVADLSTIAGYETVTLKTGKLLPINNKEHAVYFFKLTSPLFTLPDNKHMFFGGYAYPAHTIYEKYEQMGGGKFDSTQEWWQINLENWIASDEKAGRTPVVVYSNDAGSTFSILPVRKYLPENLYNDGTNRQVAYFAETTDGQVAGYVKEGDNDAFATNQIVIDFDDFGNVDSTATEWKQVGIPSDGEIRSFTNDAGKITYTTGRLGYGVDIDTSKMLGSDTFNFDFTGNNTITVPDGLKVARVESGNAIKFNKAITDEVTTGTYRVLFAAYTKTDIPLQEKYLSTDSSILSDYLKSNGSLKVDSVKAVTNALTANRAYYSNYPTVEEDTSKIYYTYDDDAVVPLTNNNNENIIECTEDGEHFAYQQGQNKYFIDFASSLGNGLNESQLVAQGKPSHTLKELLTNASYMEDDDDFTSLVKGSKSFIYMNEFDKNSVLAILDMNVTYDKVLETEGIEKNAEDNCYDDVVSFVEEIEDQFGLPDNNFENAEARFEYKKVGDKEYLFDNKYNTFVLKSRRYICGTLNIPYTFYNGGNGLTVTPNPVIEYSDETGNMIKAGALASGIYYHPMGYGGLRNNTSISKTTPWNRDPAAFTEDYLKNSTGDYVYLTDNKGSRVKVYDAAQLLEDDGYDISYDSFLNEGNNSITIKKVDDTVETVNFYKLHRTDIRQKHSCDYVRKNSKVLLRFYKNATRITDFTFEDGSKVGYLYNYNGEKCYNATIDDNGFLNVGDAIGTPTSTLTTNFIVNYEANGQKFADTVTSSFTLNSSNATPWVDAIEGTDQTVVYYKGYGIISKPDEGSNTNTKTVTYKLSITDNDGVFDLSTADIKTSECSYSIEDGKLVVSYAAGIDYRERTVSINGITVWNAAVIEIDDEIIKYKKPVLGLGGSSIETSDFYLGDILAPEDVAIPTELITEKTGEILYLGYSRHIDAEAGTLVTGAYGYSISKKPKYDTFQNLLYGEGVMIDKSISFSEDKLTSMKVVSTAEDNSEIKLNAPVTFGDYNDGVEHYFKFKILTVAEQSLAAKHMNDSSYYYELSKEQMDLYTPNRVWYNPKGSPTPPIKVGQKIFNSENNYAYYDKDYRNNNDVNIYMCDEEGHYVNFDENGVEYRLDENKDGDCSSNVYMGVDNRYVSPKPINPTCQDWYYENIYTPNNEVNPLWQIIHISPKIENKKWVQKISLCRYKKSGASQLLVDDVQYPYITMNTLNQLESEDGTIKVKENIKNFDADDGDIELLLSEGSDYYKNLINNEDGDMTLYGLNFDVSKMSNMYNDDNSELSATLQASYTVNTLRDFTTNVQDDSTIAKITEMGIFDKNHKLIAYAQFPPIEYRTEKQHAAFTAVIYHGNMVSN